MVRFIGSTQSIVLSLTRAWSLDGTDGNAKMDNNCLLLLLFKAGSQVMTPLSPSLTLSVDLSGVTTVLGLGTLSSVGPPLCSDLILITIITTLTKII